MLAPTGASDGGTTAWNASNSCCWTGGGAPNDVAYLGGLIDEVLAASPSWNVDPKRIYVIGHSNGGFMAMRLACEREDVIAAVFDLAGAGPSASETCTLSEPVAFAHAHGTSDATIVPGGGTFAGMGTAYTSVATTLANLATANGCGGSMSLVTSGYADFTTTVGGSETNLHEQSGCSGHAKVRWYEGTSAGHVYTWTAAGSTEITTFLLANPKP